MTHDRQTLKNTTHRIPRSAGDTPFRVTAGFSGVFTGRKSEMISKFWKEEKKFLIIKNALSSEVIFHKGRRNNDFPI